jgi:hypothetical protein
MSSRFTSSLLIFSALLLILIFFIFDQNSDVKDSDITNHRQHHESPDVAEINEEEENTFDHHHHQQNLVPFLKSSRKMISGTVQSCSCCVKSSDESFAVCISRKSNKIVKFRVNPFSTSIVFPLSFESSPLSCALYETNAGETSSRVICSLNKKRNSGMLVVLFLSASNLKPITNNNISLKSDSSFSSSSAHDSTIAIDTPNKICYIQASSSAVIHKIVNIHTSSPQIATTLSLDLGSSSSSSSSSVLLIAGFLYVHLDKRFPEPAAIARIDLATFKHDSTVQFENEERSSSNNVEQELQEEEI